MNVWKDLSKTIQCDGNQTNVITGQGSYSNNVRVTKNAAKWIHDLVDNYPKDHLPWHCQRKMSKNITKFKKSIK